MIYEFSMNDFHNYYMPCTPWSILVDCGLIKIILIFLSHYGDLPVTAMALSCSRNRVPDGGTKFPRTYRVELDGRVANGRCFNGYNG